MVLFWADTLDGKLLGKAAEKKSPKKEGSASILDEHAREEDWLRHFEMELAKTHHHSDGSPVHLTLQKGKDERRLSESVKEDYKPDQAPARALCDCGKEVRLDGKDTGGYSKEKASGGYANKEEHRPDYDNSTAGYNT